MVAIMKMYTIVLTLTLAPNFTLVRLYDVFECTMPTQCTYFCRPHVVTLEWLSASIKKGSLEKESNCIYSYENREEESKQTVRGIQQPSPLSEKV